MYDDQMECFSFKFVSSAPIVCDGVTIPATSKEDVDAMQIFQSENLLPPNPTGTYYLCMFRNRLLHISRATLTHANICHFHRYYHIEGQYMTEENKHVLIFSRRTEPLPIPGAQTAQGVPLSPVTSPLIQLVSPIAPMASPALMVAPPAGAKELTPSFSVSVASLPTIQMPTEASVPPAIALLSAPPPTVDQRITLKEMMVKYDCSLRETQDVIKVGDNEYKSYISTERIEKTIIEQTLHQQAEYIDFYGTSENIPTRIKMFTPIKNRVLPNRGNKKEPTPYEFLTFQKEKFDRAYMVQLSAYSENHIAPYPLAFWRCADTAMGVIMFESIQGVSLLDAIFLYGNDPSILTMFTKLISCIFLLSLKLRWAHTNLMGLDGTGRNIIYNEEGVWLTDFEYAVKCPPDSIMVAVIYGPALANQNYDDRTDFRMESFKASPGVYSKFIIRDLINVCQGFARIAGNALILGKLESHSPAAWIRNALFASGLTKAQTWFDFYKGLVSAKGKAYGMPTVEEAKTKFMTIMNTHLPSNLQISPFSA